MPNRYLLPSETPDHLRACFNASQYQRSPEVENEVGGIVVGLANAYADITATDPEWIANIFTERTNGLQVYTDKSMIGKPGVARFTAMSGSLLVSEGILETGDYEYVLAHEVGHAASISKIFKPNHDYESSRHKISGVNRNYIDADGNPSDDENDQHASWWLNESAIDLLAYRATGKQHTIGYLYGGAVLGAYFKSDPDMEKELYRNIYFDGNTDRAIGALDTANYPGWSEEVGGHIRAIENWRSTGFDLKIYNPAEEIIDTLPREIKVLAKEMIKVLHAPIK